MTASEGWGTTLSKFVIFVFLVMAAVAATNTGIQGWKLVRERKALQEDERRFKTIRQLGPTVQSLWEAGYTAEKRREERQTGNWTSFFASTLKAAGLEGKQYKLPAGREVPGRGYTEHSFEIGIRPNSGVTRQMVARFLWSVESQRTYLRTRAFNLKRGGDEEDWGGSITIAYREKR
ncbi:MAG: hypothetical protein ACYTHM_04355 [Planctomycetota bacterium]|jgi:hypothetical protein